MQQDFCNYYPYLSYSVRYSRNSSQMLRCSAYITKQTTRVLKMSESRVLYSFLFILIITSLAGCSNKYLAEVPAVPRHNITGQVTDAVTGYPVENAILYVNGTEFKGQTDSNGHFTVDRIPNGTYEVLIIAPNYHNHYEKARIYDGQVNDSDNYSFEAVSLTSDLNNLPDAPDEAIRILQEQVRSLQNQLSSTGFTFNQQWVSNLQLFQRYFLGSERTSEINILNPQSLNFYVDPDQRGHLLSANSKNPLLIVNNILGYRIEMVIDTLIIRRNSFGIDMQYQGISNFTDIETDNIEQIEIWEDNRQNAFEGSLRHFLMTLPTGKMHNQGFEIFSGVRVQGPRVIGSVESSVNEVGIFDRDVLRPGIKPYEYILDPPGELVITHSRTDPKDKKDFALTDRDVKRSYIQLDNGPAQFNSNALVLNPETMRISGYWRYEQVIEMLPHYYNPHISHSALR